MIICVDDDEEDTRDMLLPVAEALGIALLSWDKSLNGSSSFNLWVEVVQILPLGAIILYSPFDMLPGEHILRQINELSASRMILHLHYERQFYSPFTRTNNHGLVSFRNREEFIMIILRELLARQPVPIHYPPPLLHDPTHPRHPHHPHHPQHPRHPRHPRHNRRRRQ